MAPPPGTAGVHTGIARERETRHHDPAPYQSDSAPPPSANLTASSGPARQNRWPRSGRVDRIRRSLVPSAGPRTPSRCRLRSSSRGRTMRLPLSRAAANEAAARCRGLPLVGDGVRVRSRGSSDRGFGTGERGVGKRGYAPSLPGNLAETVIGQATTARGAETLAPRERHSARVRKSPTRQPEHASFAEPAAAAQRPLRPHAGVPSDRTWSDPGHPGPDRAPVPDPDALVGEPSVVGHEAR